MSSHTTWKVTYTKSDTAVLRIGPLHLKWRPASTQASNGRQKKQRRLNMQPTRLVPSLMSFVGVGSEGGVGLHHAQFLPGRGALRLCAVALAANYVAAAAQIRS